MTAPAKPRTRQPKLVADLAELAVPVEAEEPPPAAEEPAPSDGKRHFIAVRRMTYQGRELQAGDDVPGAEDWPRVDAWVRARYLKEV